MRLAIGVCAAALSAWAAEPIRVHPKNPHYFEFRGKATALITSAEHYGAVLNGAFDYRKYLDALAADGLNYTRIFGGSYVEAPGKSFGIRRNTLAPEPGKFVAPWARSETPGYEGGGNQFDLAQWNPEFFARYRDFLTEAGKRGIVVEVTLFTSTYQEAQWKYSPFHPSNHTGASEAIEWKKLNTLDNGGILAHQEQYVRKLVREANGFDHVFFEIQNEPWADRAVLGGVVNPYLREPARDRYPNSIDLADGLSMAWQAKVAEWIASEEAGLPNQHLIAQNYANFGLPVKAVAPGVSVVNFHYAYPFAVEANYGLKKVIGYDETGFMPSDDDAYRRQAWNFLFAGGGLFNNLDYTFTVGKEDGSDTEPNGPGSGGPALRKQLGILSRFVQALPLASMTRAARTVVHASGVYARALSGGGELAVYLDGDGPAEVVLELGAGRYAGEWLDPRTGAATKIEAFRHSGGERSLRSPEFQKGLALRLTRATGR